MSTLDIQRDVPLAPLTTLGLGGAAKFFIRVEDEPGLLGSLNWASDQGVRTAVLGGGSNLIVPDAGYDGLVIQMGIAALDLYEDGRARVGAGVPWETVVDAAVSRGWAGVECLTGIPGSTGATPIQNVGAYGQEIAEVIDCVHVVRRDSLQSEVLAAAECGFSYRDSLFRRRPERFIVTAVELVLRPGGRATIRYAELEQHLGHGASLDQVRDAVLDLRRRKSMVIDPSDPNRRSAGSFFLNPIVDSAEADRLAEKAAKDGIVDSPSEVPRYPADGDRTKLAAGWLIEKSGIAKGTRRGPIGVSTKHALALVHHGGGTASELLAFAAEIQRRVHDRFGVTLEREPRLLE